MALKSSTRRMLKRASRTHLGRETRRQNTGRRKFNKATQEARRKQAAHLKKNRGARKYWLGS